MSWNAKVVAAKQDVTVCLRMLCALYTSTIFCCLCLQGSVPNISPPRERKKPQTVEVRKFSWATQRIHDLEKELEHAKAKIKVCALSSQACWCSSLPCHSPIG